MKRGKRLSLQGQLMAKVVGAFRSPSPPPPPPFSLSTVIYDDACFAGARFAERRKVREDGFYVGGVGWGA